MAFLDNFRRTDAGRAMYARARQMASRFGLGKLLPTTGLGSFGDIIFTVSSEKVFTYSSMSRKTSVNYATHAIIGTEPVLEYVAPEVEEMTVTIKLLSTLGVDPAEECEKIRKIVLAGKSDYFIIDGQPIGGAPWVISEMSVDNTIFDGNGRGLVASVSLTLKKAPDVLGGGIDDNYDPWRG